MNPRPSGYELRSDPPLSPFRPICPSCARLSQSAWNHHSLRCSPALSAFGSRFGSGEFPGIQSLMTGAETVSKIAPQNNEESAVCLLKIELTFSFTRYKVTRKASCFCRENVPLEHGTEICDQFSSLFTQQSSFFPLPWRGGSASVFPQVASPNARKIRWDACRRG